MSDLPHNQVCDVVVERVALGESLGELAEHAAGCARCRRVAALPVELAATHRDGDPGVGFASRITVGAQQRVVTRRRRRIAGGASAAAAVTLLGAFALTRDPSTADVRSADLNEVAAVDERQPDPWEPRPEPTQPDDSVDEDVRALVELANTKRSRKLSAPWRRIEKPLEPYRIVFQGVKP